MVLSVFEDNNIYDIEELFLFEGIHQLFGILPKSTTLENGVILTGGASFTELAVEGNNVVIHPTPSSSFTDEIEVTSFSATSPFQFISEIQGNEYSRMKVVDFTESSLFISLELEIRADIDIITPPPISQPEILYYPIHTNDSNGFNEVIFFDTNALQIEEYSIIPVLDLAGGDIIGELVASFELLPPEVSGATKALSLHVNSPPIAVDDSCGIGGCNLVICECCVNLLDNDLDINTLDVLTTTITGFPVLDTREEFTFENNIICFSSSKGTGTSEVSFIYETRDGVGGVAEAIARFFITFIPSNSKSTTPSQSRSPSPSPSRSKSNSISISESSSISISESSSISASPTPSLSRFNLPVGSSVSPSTLVIATPIVIPSNSPIPSSAISVSAGQLPSECRAKGIWRGKLECNGQVLVEVPPAAPSGVDIIVSIPNPDVIRNSDIRDVDSLIVDIRLSDESASLGGSVEICLQSTSDSDDQCLGFLNEEKSPPIWECQDRCLNTNNDGLFCGSTDHFTNFALLLGGGGSTGQGGVCGESFNDYITGSILGDFLLILGLALFVCMICVIVVIIATIFPKLALGSEGARIRKSRKAAASLNHQIQSDE